MTPNPVFERTCRRGVLACGNFALTVVLLQKFAETAARLIPQWEIIDYAADDEVDAPSATARELAFRLSGVRNPELTVPLASTVGPRETRGATVSGSQVHVQPAHAAAPFQRASSACTTR